MRATLIVAACALAAACARHRTPIVSEPELPMMAVVSTAAPIPDAPGPTTKDVWQFTLLSVAPLAQRGDFVAADSVLTAFATGHGGTCEAAEAKYVQALLRLSPNNTRTRTESALPLLDEYLSSNCVAPARAAEALLVRRIASDLMRQNFVGDSAASEEIKKLKEQLEQAKKELDRLKMRVIPPAP